MRLLRRLVVGLLALVSLLVAGLALAAYLLDLPALIEKYKPIALEAGSQALDRRLAVAKVTPSWFPVIGVRLEGLEIGDRPLGERSPEEEAGPTFLELGRAEVGLAVWPALVSMGRDVQIRSIRLEQPELHIVRHPDGSFNFETIGGAASSTAAAPAPSGSPSEAQVFLERLERAGIGEVVIADGRVRYEDTTPDGVGAIEIRHLDFEAKNIELGSAIEATLSAALKGAQEPNLRVKVLTTPLAEEPTELGAPGLAALEVQADGVPLSILPMKVEGLRLADALLDAALVAKLTEGQVRLDGPLAVRQVRLTQPGLPPGHRFDARAELSVQTSTAFARLRFDGTKVQLGPLAARLAGRARISPTVQWSEVEVNADAVPVREVVALLPGPRLEVPGGKLQFTVESSGRPASLDAALRAKWSGFDYVQPALRADGAVTLTASMKGPPAQPQFELGLDLGGLQVVGDGFRKPSGMETVLAASGEVRADGIRVAPVRVGVGAATFTGGGFYPTGSRGKVDFGAAMEEIAVAPWLKSLSISSEGLPAGSELGLKLRYQASPGAPAAGRLDLNELSFRAGESSLIGSAEVASFEPVQLRVRGRSPFLDLDALLPASEADTAGEGGTSGDADAPLLPPSMRDLRVDADLEVTKLRYSGLDLSRVDVRLVVEDGRLEVRSTKFGLLGGRFVADGTELNLISSPPKYAITAQLESIKGQALFEKVAGWSGLLSGDLETKVKLNGAGFDPESLAKSLDGDFFLALANGRLDGIDLISATVLPLRDALEFAGTTRQLGLGKRLGTQFSRLAGRVEVNDGQMRLRKPMKISTKEGNIELRGGMRLDGQLDLQGEIALVPDLIRRLTAGKVRTKRALPVKFGLGCTVTSPCIRNVDVGPAAAELTRLYAGKAIDKAAKVLERETGIDASKAKAAADAVLRDAEAAKAKAQAEAERRAKQAAEAAKRQAEAAARRAADAAKKKAEEEAKKRLRGLFGR